MQSVKPNELPQNPRERANCISKLCFWHTLEIFFKGTEKTLDQGDLYRTLEEHRSEYLGSKLAKAWEDEIRQKELDNKEPSLLRATSRVFIWNFVFLGVVLFILEIGLRSIQPLFLLGLISHYTTGSDNLNKAYFFAVGLIICSGLNVLIMHPYMLGTMHVGMKMRVAMCSLIYRKALRLSQNALGDTTAGQVVNLISNDVGRLDLSTIFVHYLWIGPLETLLILLLMYMEIGVSAIFGVAFMFMFIPLQGILGKRTSILRLKTAIRTDERVRMMNEIITGIQVIKMYAWEIPFGKMVAYARKREIQTIRHVSYIRGLLLSLIIFLTRVSIFLSLVGYVLLSNILTPEKAFVITAYYNILRTTMTVFFPQGIGQLAETLVSFKRIQKYLFYEETQVHDKSEGETDIYNDSNQTSILKDEEEPLKANLKEETAVISENAKLSDAGIILTHVRAKWVETSLEYTLDDVSFRAQPGTLVAIIGPVGSGKSSLIQAILGELRPNAGSIKVNGTVSYASQEPWLFTGSVRQNILFGQPMNRKRYNAVVKKCALERDFELLPYSDRTIVGERGASLSGGQKARISLARAVYRETSIYLLDDPLSAVDTHVGRHLFDQCMRDFLRENIVVLVTHQLQFLQNADQIVIMEKGRVSAVGTYDTLRESGLDFAKLLADPEKEENNENKNERLILGSSSYKRQSSETSLTSTTDSILDDDPTQQQELQEQGQIGCYLYQKYFKAGGGFFLFFVAFFFCVLSQAMASYGDYFLSYWVAKQTFLEANQKVLMRSGDNLRKLNVTDYIQRNNIPSNPGNFSSEPSQVSQLLKEFMDLDIDPEMLDIYIFSFITIFTIIVTLARSFMFFNLAMKASQNLHNAMFRGITRASMYFFNTNPSGRILNRFSKDMGQVDEILPAVLMDVVQIFLTLIGIVVVIAIVNPIFLIPVIVLAVIFYNLRSFYLQTSRDIKRLEGITRSPVYSHLAASLNGLPTIRAFGAQKVLIAEFDNHQNLHSSAFYLFISTSRAFGYWLDCFCVVFIAIITLSFFVFSPSNGAAVGLAITQAMGLTGMVQWGMRQSAELENTMTAVERVVEYDDIEPEGELESKPDHKPPAEWPEEGRIVFDGLSLKYFPDPKAEYVLKSLNIEIKPMEKVGIVGRTGAGKSSLINALFRLSYNEGSILIDSRDTNELGLHDLRSKISIIPQEPVLFSGTMRYNLDPFEEYTDSKLWEALEEVKLKSVISELPNGLLSKISEGGANFSVGQRQLVCLARAILRENKILVMDEATANVDPQTDALIQTTIRSKFKYCTVLTIAHRLHTVMDSDKVIVMDAGRCVEIGTPYELLTQSDKKIFYDMVMQTGKTTFDNLLKVAEKAHQESLKQRME